MQRLSFGLIPAVLLVAWSTAPAVAQEASQPTYITFQVPGSSVLGLLHVNRNLTVAGYYFDSTGAHGFIRDLQGTITTVDPSGSNGTTFVAGISSDGTVIGSYGSGAIGTLHGFLRNPEGTITTFDVPGSASTVINGINSAGSITGRYRTAGGEHGYILDSRGMLTTFDVPGSIFTNPAGINSAGEVVGTWTDATLAGHGFVRKSDGTITSFDPPQGRMGFSFMSINRHGVIAGSYDTNFLLHHGFVRSQEGAITSIDVPGSITAIMDLSAFGITTGYYLSPQGEHGFVRSPQGTITSFDVPGASWTTAYSINNFGAIAGVYADSTGAEAGYLRLPAEFEN